MKRRFLAAVLVAASLALPGAGHAQAKASADKPKPPDPKVLEAVFGAFAAGLPKRWDRAWVVVAEVRDKAGARDFEVQCLYQGPGDDPVGKPIAGCDRKTVFENVWSLNGNMPNPEQRRWTSATLAFQPDGKFELNYKYPDTLKQKDDEKKKK
ncbi:MAG: DUF600 family protein [bacterium]|jgi:hypothetical protein